MKNIIEFFFVCLTTISLVNAQNCTNSLTFVADTSGGKYYTIQLNNNNPSTSAPNSPYFESFAWTDNASGHPINNGRTICRFDLSSIPKNVNITRATINASAVYTLSPGPSYGTNNSAFLQRIVSSYDISGQNTGWNNAPLVSTVDEKILAQSTNEFESYSVDITDFVKLWVNQPDSNWGMMLRLRNETFYNRLTFYSFGAPTDSLNLKIQVCYSTTLPTEIYGLEGIVNNGIAKVSWKTNSEERIVKYYLQKSLDGKDFENVARIESKGSKIANDYSVNDSILNLQSAYYRIKGVDVSDNYIYSNSIKVNNENLKNQFSIFPNPINNLATVSFNSLVAGNVTLRIYNIYGRLLKEERLVTNLGKNDIPLSNVKYLERGIYIIQFWQNNEHLGETKFIKK